LVRQVKTGKRVQRTKRSFYFGKQTGFAGEKEAVAEWSLVEREREKKPDREDAFLSLKCCWPLELDRVKNWQEVVKGFR